MLLVPHGWTNVIPGPRCGPRCRTRPRRRRRRWPRRRVVGPPGRGFARLGARPTSLQLFLRDAPTLRGVSLLLPSTAKWDWRQAQRGRYALHLARRQLKRLKSFYRPSWLRRVARGGSLHSLPAASFMEWRQDVVVEASSGVVHASFQVYQDQKQAGSAVLVSYRPLALSQPSHF